jgi:hypothetical protein
MLTAQYDLQNPNFGMSIEMDFLVVPAEIQLIFYFPAYWLRPGLL